MIASGFGLEGLSGYLQNPNTDPSDKNKRGTYSLSSSFGELLTKGVTVQYTVQLYKFILYFVFA